mmetsp:Transcript_29579/g.28310  ORF Transcript_29579/g.28310 Transcript_29579/m.28310 type:complete len:340 (-) Transcript_29579:47-1066(-)|eukprot:CAMPEP_0119033126 /NCGR_PEP_ID=MMETSP1177-20130426/118_1 /TAXON_ID=2985 /ORGANISM="Ochromonas sp, Strain CCMP1899" /LENGTH=339 /DNA_ID=CAMNT_0006989609 /DNA_START=268 /DNA_END=1287 /DNA_ORIENTATION=-
MAHFNDVDGDLELDDNLFEFWAGLYDIDEVTSAFASSDKTETGNDQMISTIPIVSTDDEDATTNLTSSTSDDDETIETNKYDNKEVNKVIVSNSAAATAFAATASYKFNDIGNDPSIAGVKRKNNDDYINGYGRKKDNIVDNVEHDSVLSDDQINIELAKIPARLARAANAGDMDLLREIVNTNMTTGMILRTSGGSETLTSTSVGRDQYVSMHEGLSVSHPDLTTICKGAKIVTDEEGRCITYRFYFTGTRTIPGSTDFHVPKPENAKDLVNLLDFDLLSPEEIADMKLIAVKIRASGQSYVAYGRGRGRLALDDNNKITEFSTFWKLSSFKEGLKQI